MISENKLRKFLKKNFTGSPLSVRKIAKEMKVDFEDLLTPVFRLKDKGVLAIKELRELGRPEPVDINVRGFVQSGKESILNHPLAIYLIYPVLVGTILLLGNLFLQKNNPTTITRVEIINLAERAVWSWEAKSKSGGDEGAYEELMRIRNELSKEKKKSELLYFVMDQIENVRYSYRNTDVVSTFPPLLMPSERSGYYCYDLQLSTQDIIERAMSDNPWYVHAKAAYLLRFRPEKSVPKALIKIMNASSSLFVRKVATDSFCIITGIQKNYSLDFASPFQQWLYREKEYIGKLKNDNQTPIDKNPLPLDKINKKFVNPQAN